MVLKLANLAAAFVLLLFTTPTQASPVEETLTKAATLYLSGKALSAVSLVEKALSETTIDQIEAKKAYIFLFELCADIYDLGCIERNFKKYHELSEGEGTSDIEKAYKFYFMNYYLFSIGNKDNLEAQAASLANIAEPVWVRLYVNSLLLSARRFVDLHDYVSANKSIDKALSLILTLNKPEKYYTAAWLSEMIELLTFSGNFLKAYNIYQVAGNFIASSLPLTDFKFAQFRFREGVLLSYLGKWDISAKAFAESIKTLSQIEIPKKVTEHLVLEAKINLAVACTMGGAISCANEAIKDAETSESLIKEGKFSNPKSLRYVAAATLAKRLQNLSVPDKWVTAFENGFHGDVDPVVREVHYGYQKAALGLIKRQDNPQETKEFSELAKTRINLFKLNAKGTQEGFYLPSAFDRFALWLSLAGVANDKLSEHERHDLAFKLIEAYNRNLRSADSDAQALIAKAPDESARREVHSLMRLSARQNSEEINRLSNLIEKLKGTNATGPSEENKTYNHGIRRYLADYGIRRQEIRESLSISSPRYTDYLLPNLADLQHDLGKQEVFVSTAFGHGELVQLCIRSDSVLIKAREIDATSLFKDVRLIKAALSAGHAPNRILDAQFPADSAIRLYEGLLKPIVGCIKEGDHVIWVPDELLLTLPLSVLFTKKPPKLGDGLDLYRADWLVRHYSFSYYPSARGFLASRELTRKRKSPSSFLGIGDPVLSGKTAEGLDRVSVLIKRSAVGNSGELKNLPELPDTSNELIQAGSQFEPNAKLLLRDKATEGHFRREPLGMFDILSFATHGLVKEEIKGLTESALVLTPQAENNPHDNGLITASEIADLNLSARLAVLAACNTANYDIEHFGRGVHSLPTAFALAGVPSTLITLWPVESSITFDLMTGMYKHFSKGSMGISESLRQATLFHLNSTKDSTYLHPRFWAPFVVFGDGGVIHSDAWPAEMNGTKLEHLVVEEHEGGGEAYKLVKKNDQGLYATGYAGLEDRKRYKSFVASLNKNGVSEWVIRDKVIGASNALAQVSGGLVTAGFVSGSDGEMDVIVTRYDSQGMKIWQKPQLFGARDGFPIGIVKINNDNLVLAVSTTQRNNGQDRPIVMNEISEKKRSIFLIKMSVEDGEELGRMELDLPEFTSSLVSGEISLIDGKLVLMLADEFINSGAYPTVDSYKETRICFENRAISNLYLIEPEKLQIIYKALYKNIVFNDVILGSNNQLLFAVTAYSRCFPHNRALLMSLDKDYKLSNLFTDLSPFASEGKKVIRSKTDGKIFLVGSSRSVHSLEEPVVRSGFDPVTFPIEANKHSQSDVVIWEMDETGKFKDRKWVQAGTSIWLNDALLDDDLLWVSGSVGNQPMWASIKLH